MKERNKKEKPDIVNSIKEYEFKELYVNTEFGKMFVKVFNNNQYHDLNQKNINQDTIVFLHGFGMNHNTFDNIIKRMVESNTLYLVIREFNSAKGYLGPDKISAVDCGYIFEASTIKYCI